MFVCDGVLSVYVINKNVDVYKASPNVQKKVGMRQKI